jgi:hypothetical protein
MDHSEHPEDIARYIQCYKSFEVQRQPLSITSLGQAPYTQPPPPPYAPPPLPYAHPLYEQPPYPQPQYVQQQQQQQQQQQPYEHNYMQFDTMNLNHNQPVASVNHTHCCRGCKVDNEGERAIANGVCCAALVTTFCVTNSCVVM